MRSIAIDLWNKRCWIALEVQKIAIPKKVVARINIIKELKNFLREYGDITHIIVWLPYDLYQKDFKQLDKTKKFIEKLNLIFPDKEIVWVDERFTTFWAEEVLRKMWKNTNSEKDDISASLILESYLK